MSRIQYPSPSLSIDMKKAGGSGFAPMELVKTVLGTGDFLRNGGYVAVQTECFACLCVPSCTEYFKSLLVYLG